MSFVVGFQGGEGVVPEVDLLWIGRIPWEGGGRFPVVPEVGSLGRGVVLNDPDDDPNTPRRARYLWRGRGLVEWRC